MSLNFNYSKVKNIDNFFTEKDAAGDQRMKAELECMIWLTMAIGINVITEKNAEEVFKRVNMVETVSGAYRTIAGGGKVFFTLAEVKSLIGLSTNASAKTALQFDKGIMRILKENASQELRRQQT